MLYIELICFIFSIILIFLNFSMFYAIRANKAIRNKEDNLFLYKTLSTSIFLFFYVVLYIAIIFKLCENIRENIFYKCHEYLFNIYILFIYAINLFSSFEMYFNYKNPIHYFLIIFDKKSPKIYEILIIILVSGFIVLDIIDPLNFGEILKIKNKEIKSYGSPFIIIDNIKWILFLIMNSISIIFNILLINILKKFHFEKREKCLKMIRKKTICQYLYLCYAFYNLLVAGILFIQPKIKIKTTIIQINSFLILMILIIESIIEISILSTSKFSQYILHKNVISCFSHIFPNDFIEEAGYDIGVLSKSNMASTLSSDDTSSSDYDESSTEIEKTLLPKCKQDEELIKIYQNKIYIEDYFMSFLDQYLNILTSSLFKIYNSKLFSVKSSENKQFQKEFNDLSLSQIGDSANSTMTMDLSTSAIVTENFSKFSLDKNRKKDNFREFRDILGNTPEDINVKIVSCLTDKCVMNIRKFNLNPKQIASSLINHFVIQKKQNDNLINNSNFISLTSTNLKEEYFKNLKKVSFKSNDKFFNFEFFETKDESISNDKLSILNNYFDYIQNGKGKTGSFLPEVIGIFKITINKFNPILLFISKNVLVENIPNNFFTFWQLINFDNDNPKKVASSKYKRNTLVKEDNIFERFLIEGKMTNIFLKNFSEFKDIIENDFNFLQQNRILNVNFLMMYLEYENTKKHETKGAIQIHKNINNEAEIVDIKFSAKSMNDNLIENKDRADSIIKINEIKNKKEEENSDAFFSDEGFDLLPDLGKTSHSLLDYAEKVNISGYEGNYDDFVCMCFFTFENVFDLKNKNGMKPDNEFKNKILDKFVQYKKPENS